MPDYRVGTTSTLTDADLCRTRFGTDPRGTYNPGAERLTTLDGTTVDVGYPRATWRFIGLTYAYYEAWLTLLGGAYSGVLYVETRDDVADWAVYRALIRLPEPATLNHWGGRYREVTVELVLLEEV